MLKTKLRERWAASSLLLVIILPPFFLALLYAFQSTAMRLAELDYLRAQKAAADYARVHFDRDLWQNFRLWAGQEVGDIESVIRLLPSKPRAELKIVGDEEALQPADLKRQIKKQIQERLPLLLTAEATDRLRLLKASQAEMAATNVEVASTLQPGDLDLLENLPRGDGSEEPVDGEGVNPEGPDGDVLPPGSEDLGGADTPGLGEAVLRKMQRRLDRHKEELVSTYHGGDLAEVPVDSLQQLGQLGQWADRYTQAMADVDLGKMSLVEYILSYCPAEVVDRRTQTLSVPLRRLDGVPHKKLKEKYGGALVETFLTGLSPERAAKRVQLYILALRLAAHDASLNTQPSQRRKYRIYGTVLSGTVAVLTAGTVVLPPEVYTQALIFARATVLAHQDVKKLKVGEGVPVWPDERVKVDLYYHDYLRLFAYARSEEKLLYALRTKLQELYPAARYASYRIESSWAGYQHQFQVGYNSEVTDED